MQELLKLAIKSALKAGERTLKFYKGEFDVVVKDDHSPLTLADLESNQVILEYLSDTDIPILSEETKIMSYSERKKWKKFWLVDPLDGTKEFINKSSEYTVNIALIEKNHPIMGVVFAPALNTIYFGSKETGSYKAIVNTGDSPKEVLKKAVKLQLEAPDDQLRVVASRSHLSNDTKKFIEELKSISDIGNMQSYGSSLKLCMVAEGSADIYPRLGPTMEWDTAASHAVAEYAGCEVFNAVNGKSVSYNKEDLLNPWFIVCNSRLKDRVVQLIKK